MENRIEPLRPAPWQVFLGDVLQDRQLLLALAEDLGFHHTTLERWCDGKVPRDPERTLRNLVWSAVFPAHRRDQFIEEVSKSYPHFQMSVPPPDELPTKEVPSTFYSEVIRSHALVADPLLYYTLTNRIVNHLFGHLDGNEEAKVGVMIWRSTPPSELGVIRSLYLPVEQVGDRLPPLAMSFPVFIGMESPLASVVPGRPLVLSESEIQGLSTPLPGVKSLALVTIQRQGKVAGCFLVSSVKAGYFDGKERQKTVSEYGLLSALAFNQNDFFAPDQTKLLSFPTLETQQKGERDFPFMKRMRRLRETLEEEARRKEGKVQKTPNQVELRLLALQELEEHLIVVQRSQTSGSNEQGEDHGET